MINRNKTIALLPMKMNSVRLKGKNFRSFCGKPLFHWILETLLSVSAIDKIVINTDARHVLATHGLVDGDRVVIRDRRPDICGDHVSMNEVLADDVENVPASLYLMTHTTNPLLSADTIKKAVSDFASAKAKGLADSLFTVKRVQSRFYRADCSAVNHDPKNLIPTQCLEPWFEENSNLYLFSQESFSRTKARIGERPMMYETPPLESIDIDNQADWDFAVVAANFLNANMN